MDKIDKKIIAHKYTGYRWKESDDEGEGESIKKTTIKFFKTKTYA